MVGYFLHGDSFYPLYFPSPRVSLDLMINDQPYVETRDSACSP